MEKLQAIIGAVVNGNISETKALVRRAVDEGVDAMQIINEGLVAGLNVVGERFEAEEMFIPELVLSGVTAKAGIEIATEGLGKGEYKPKATVVLGTVKGDIHDLGKNLVGLILRISGFEVIDLGVNVDEEEFISAVREHKPAFLGMSCLMTMTMPGMKDVVDALTEAGLRDTVKVLVGGCSVSQDFASQIGADGYARHAAAAAVLLERLLTEIKG